NENAWRPLRKGSGRGRHASALCKLECVTVERAAQIAILAHDAIAETVGIILRHGVADRIALRQRLRPRADLRGPNRGFPPEAPIEHVEVSEHRAEGGIDETEALAREPWPGKLILQQL